MSQQRLGIMRHFCTIEPVWLSGLSPSICKSSTTILRIASVSDACELHSHCHDADHNGRYFTEGEVHSLHAVSEAEAISHLSRRTSARRAAEEEARAAEERLRELQRKMAEQVCTYHVAGMSSTWRMGCVSLSCNQRLNCSSSTGFWSAFTATYKSTASQAGFRGHGSFSLTCLRCRCFSS